jgi:predicted nuclease with TOPRIM domain
MKKKKRLILGLGIVFIVIVCIQIFSSGHKHVVVVEDNINLTSANKSLKKQNSGLKKNISNLKAKNEELVEDKANLTSMVSKVIGSLDSTKSIVKDIKKELANEKDINNKQSNGEVFDFEPIKLPVKDNN